jgi:hypothetical protein
MPYKRLVALLLALGVVAGLVACGGGGSDTTSAGGGSETSAAEGGGGSAPPTIVVRNGEPVNGVETLEFSAGEQAEFRVSSNTATEVHVHGYDIEEEVPAGGTATFSFPAELEGIYDVELHPSEEQIAELRVNP